MKSTGVDSRNSGNYRQLARQIQVNRIRWCGSVITSIGGIAHDVSASIEAALTMRMRVRVACCRSLGKRARRFGCQFGAAADDKMLMCEWPGRALGKINSRIRSKP